MLRSVAMDSLVPHNTSSVAPGTHKRFPIHSLDSVPAICAKIGGLGISREHLLRLSKRPMDRSLM